MAGVEPLPADLLKQKIREGVLPREPCRRTWFGRGLGQPCAGCGRPLTSEHVEVECEFASAETVRFHRECFEAWEAARQALE